MISLPIKDCPLAHSAFLLQEGEGTEERGKDVGQEGYDKKRKPE